jgi:hypothetical protein
MPYKSKAQERFFHTETAANEGIKPNQVAEWDQASKGKRLPERAAKTNAHKHAHKAMGQAHIEAKKLTPDKEHPEYKKIPPMKAAHLLYEKHVASKKAKV